ncbi:hypothetical protein XFF6992_260112 [Xanthomonas citri pv. fuscans]|nr:hypothetical protein XFF6992_260112 [Xanthomonas citri pv. fuscans]
MKSGFVQSLYITEQPAPPFSRHVLSALRDAIEILAAEETPLSEVPDAEDAIATHWLK